MSECLNKSTWCFSAWGGGRGPHWWLLFSKAIKEVALCCGFPYELQAVYYRNGLVFFVVFFFFGEGLGSNSEGKAQHSTAHWQNCILFTIAKQTKNKLYSSIGTVLVVLGWHISLNAFEILKKSKLEFWRNVNFQKSKLKVIIELRLDT